MEVSLRDGDYDDATKAQESIWIYMNFMDGNVQLRFNRMGIEQETLSDNKMDRLKDLKRKHQVKIQRRETGYVV